MYPMKIQNGEFLAWTWSLACVEPVQKYFPKSLHPGRLKKHTKIYRWSGLFFKKPSKLEISLPGSVKNPLKAQGKLHVSDRIMDQISKLCPNCEIKTWIYFFVTNFYINSQVQLDSDPRSARRNWDQIPLCCLLSNWLGRRGRKWGQKSRCSTMGNIFTPQKNRMPW